MFAIKRWTRTTSEIDILRDLSFLEKINKGRNVEIRLCLRLRCG